MTRDWPRADFGHYHVCPRAEIRMQSLNVHLIGEPQQDLASVNIAALVLETWFARDYARAATEAKSNLRLLTILSEKTFDNFNRLTYRSNQA